MSKSNGSMVEELGPVTNGGRKAIECSQPYIVDVTIEGTADLLFHRWNCESIATKAASAKGSAAKKSDDIESYVYRNDAGELCLPGEYLRQAIIHAAKFRQDPRSPRKSAMDLYKAAIVPLTINAEILRNGKTLKQWDYAHQCRVTIQRNGITRTRPAIKAGWTSTIQLLVNLPEYVNPQSLNEVITNAGRLIGVGDFRPTYGRFQVTKFDVGFND